MPGSQGDWDPVRGTRHVPSLAEHCTFSRRPHFRAGLQTPQRESAQGRTRDLGPGRGARQGSEPGGAGSGRRDPSPWKGSPAGSQACTLPGRLRVLLWLKRLNPALRRQTLTDQLVLLKVSAKPPKKGLSPPRPQTSRARKPFSVKESAASCPCCLQKAFTCGEPGPRLARPGPMARTQGGNGSPRGQTSGSPRGSLGAQVNTLAYRVPKPSLDPHRTPAFCGKWASASLKLRSLGLGCKSQG